MSEMLSHYHITKFLVNLCASSLGCGQQDLPCQHFLGTSQMAKALFFNRRTKKSNSSTTSYRYTTTPPLFLDYCRHFIVITLTLLIFSMIYMKN